MKILKCAAVSALACLLVACGGGFNPIRGSGTIKTEPRDVKGFTEVEVSGSAKLVVEQGETESLTITADDNLMEYLTSNVQGSTLMLGSKEGVSIQPTQRVSYKLTVKQLSKIGVSGDVSADAREIHAESLAIAISGSGDISISGDAASQKISVSGSADYKAESFKTKDTSISISGSGKAVVAASNSLEVEVSGSGDVKYVGNPRVTKNISGSGNVQQWTP